MKVLTMKRAAMLCAGLGVVGAVGAFTFAGTSAQYSSNADAQTNSITTDTVTLTENTTASKVMNVPDFMPGDGSCYSPPAGATYVCDYPRNDYALTYSGADAFVGLDFTITSVAAQDCTSLPASSTVTSAAVASQCTGVGESPLFNGDPSSGALDLSVTPENGDTAHQLLLNSNLDATTTCSTDAAKKVTCTSKALNVLMPTGYGSAAFNGLKWVDGSTDFVQVDTGLPVGAGNQFQGSGATFTLQSHAVQFKNNNTTVGATPGCASGTTFPNGLGSTGNYCPISWG